MELRQSPEWGKYLESLGWQTEVVEGCALRIRKLGPLGSIIKIQRPNNFSTDKVEEFAKKHKALFVKLEPINDAQTQSLISNHYYLDSWPLTPSRTVMIDLNKSEQELLKSFSKDARQTLKRISNKKLVVGVLDFEVINSKNEDALHSFHSIWKETGTRNHFYVQPYPELLNKARAFGSKAVLIVSCFQASENGPARPPLQPPTPGVGTDNHGLETLNLVAGCLLLFCNGTAYYHHAASTLEGQREEAPYAVLWRAILESKRRGMEKLDLEGIFDSRHPYAFKKWINFSTFKLKWGGQVIEYPGAYVKVYNPFIKTMFWLGDFFNGDRFRSPPRSLAAIAE